MHSLKDLFSNDKKWARYLKDADDIKKIRKAWKQIVGELLSKVLFFGSFHGEKLFIVTKNPVWVNEIEFHKDHILSKIRHIFPSLTVKELALRFDPNFIADEKKEAGKNSFTVVSFEDKIKYEISKKLKLGYRLCSVCKDVYSYRKICVFCMSKQTELEIKEV